MRDNEVRERAEAATVGEALASIRPQEAVAVGVGLSIRRAIILGASPGTTHCPLAAIKPRHYWPVGGAPLMLPVFERLLGWGIESAVLSCPRATDSPAYAEMVREASRRTGLSVRIVDETRPAGSAGAVRSLAPFAQDEHVLVITGTPLSSNYLYWDLDLSGYWEPGVHASLAVLSDELEQASIPVEIGYRQGIRSAGLWILGPEALRLIPDEGHLSIDEQLLPQIEDSGGSIKAVAVGCLHGPLRDSDFQSARDRMLGEVDGVRSACAEVHPEAILTGEISIGPGVRIEAGAVVEGPASIGAGSVIRAGARVSKSVLWDRVVIYPGAQVDDAIVTDDAVVRSCGRLERAMLISALDYKRYRALLQAKDQSWGAPVLVSSRNATGIKSHNGTRCISESKSGSGLDAVSAFISRTMDIVLAVVVLVLSAPVLLLAAVAIKVQSRGPLVYKQTRSGRGGRPFTMLKLRTMVVDAHEQQHALRVNNEVDGPMFKIDRDPRITRIGAILRKTCIDELPQLINVLRGEMSIVGPRPLTDHEMSIVGSWRDIRLQVRPGITGLWQVEGRSTLSFGDWIYHDIRYITNRSLALDIRIIFKTVLIVLGCAVRAGELGRQ